jgi:hypothetical protein
MEALELVSGENACLGDTAAENVLGEPARLRHQSRLRWRSGVAGAEDPPQSRGNQIGAAAATTMLSE